MAATAATDAVEELHVELGGLDVRFRQVGDLGHQLANLVLRLLEQTRIDGFFRHGGTSGMSPPWSPCPGKLFCGDQ